MLIKACIFDLDGVIVDTAKYHFQAWKRLADILDIQFSETDNERLKGVSRMDSFEIILELGNIKMSQDIMNEYASLKNMWYVDYIKTMTPGDLLPGVHDFITEIKNEGIKVAIGSASKNTPMILERTGIEELFDAIADGNNVSKAKPDPEVFLTASELLGISSSNCVVFEDAIAGVKAAINAGMGCIGVGSKEILKGAHSVVSGLSEMSYARLKSIEREIVI